MKSLLFLMLGMLIILIFAGSFLVIDRRAFVMTTRATDNSISPENPYVFGTPSCAQANGTDIIRGSVFCLNKRGYPVANLQVKIVNPVFVSVQAIQSLTDSSGKALFNITSPQAGLYDLDVYCGDIKLNSKLKVCFN